MSLFNRLKKPVKFTMINSDAELKSETFEIFTMSGKAKENEPFSRNRATWPQQKRTGYADGRLEICRDDPHQCIRPDILRRPQADRT